jgi:predicted DsbA family dithiol-disulfide isomerase
MIDGAEPEPAKVEVFMDFHCPYSYRAVCWLDELPAGIVDVRHRLFALEQVNRDPDAASWRIWEQPLDYVHYRDRPDRRGLAAFLATAVVEAGLDGDAARRLRRAIYEARFETALDISDPDVLDAAGVTAGLPVGWIRGALLDDARTGPARERLARDWAAARSPFLVFGVPTLAFADEAPVYLRLEAAVPPSEGTAFLDALRAFRRAAPGVLELKQPDPAVPS